MLNAHDDYRQAEAAHANAARRYRSVLARAHREPRLDIEAAYVNELRAEVRRARALKRIMTE